MEKKMEEQKMENTYNGVKYKDRKISNKEIEAHGVWIEDFEILPPIDEKIQSQKRAKKEIAYSKLFGRVFYQLSDLIEFAKRNKIYVA